MQKTLHAAQNEITQLRASVAVMRDQLENTCYEKDRAAQEDMAAARLRHVSATRWGTRQYLNMDRLTENLMA